MKHVVRTLIVISVAVIIAFSVVGCISEEEHKTADIGQTGVLYNLKEAYELGLISKDDLLQIAYYQNNGEDCPQRLTDGEIASVKNARAAELRKIKYSNGEFMCPDAKEDDVTIEKYYGTYNGCHAVMLTDIYHGYSDALWSDNVGGAEIRYNCGNEIVIWCADKTE